MLGTHFRLFRMNLNNRYNAYTINTNTIQSPNTTMIPAPPNISMMDTIASSTSNMNNTVINVIITDLPFLIHPIKEGVAAALTICFVYQSMFPIVL
jgi:hypothetical protein